MKEAAKLRNGVLTVLIVTSVCLALSIWWQRNTEALPKVNVLQSDLSAFESALMMYRLNCRDYPSQEQGLSALIERPASLNPDSRWVQVVHKIPSDPWGDSYVYETVANGSTSEVRVYSRHSDLSNPKEMLVLPCEDGKERN